MYSLNINKSNVIRPMASDAGDSLFNKKINKYKNHKTSRTIMQNMNIIILYVKTENHVQSYYNITCPCNKE